MALYYDKPYVWLQSDASGSFIKIKIWDRYSRIILPVDGYFDKYEEGETLFIVFRLVSGDADESSITFDLNEPTSPRYNPSVHNKVTIIIADSDEIILGFHTIMPAMGIFGYTAGALPPFIPYAWLQFIATDQSIVHIAAEIPKRAVIDGPEIVDTLDSYMRTVNYKINGDTSGTPYVFHVEHRLDASNNFDPIIENIIINLIEYHSDGSERKKGTGTVHTSEGDASGDD